MSIFQFKNIQKPLNLISSFDNQNFLVAGSTGRHLKRKTGRQIPRITALDPASKLTLFFTLHKFRLLSFNSFFFLPFDYFSDPCFNLPGDLPGLSRDDAEFVLVIHTNPGGLGKRDPIGKFCTFF